EPAVDELVRQALGGKPAALGDRAEADLLGVADAVVELGERPPVVEIRSVDRVPRCAKLVREGEEARGLSLRVVKEQNLGHVEARLYGEAVAELLRRRDARVAGGLEYGVRNASHRHRSRRRDC